MSKKKNCNLKNEFANKNTNAKSNLENEEKSLTPTGLSDDKNKDVENVSKDIKGVNLKLNNCKIKKSNKKKYLIIVFALLIIALAVIIPILIILNKPGVINMQKQDELISWESYENAEYYLVNINGEEYKLYETTFDTSLLYPGTYTLQVYPVVNSKTQNCSGNLNFTIEKQKLSIKPLSEIIINKEYDGTLKYDDLLLLNTNYIFEQELKYGNNLNIEITKMEFDNINVQNATKLTVVHSNTLVGDDAKHYEISEASFTLEAEITPKQIQIEPEKISKQFSDIDNLYESLQDKETGETIEYNFIRESGEAIGIYDIIKIVQNNPNFNLFLGKDSGISKFEIIPKVIDVIGNKSLLLDKVYDGFDKYIDIDKLNLQLMYTIQNVVSGYTVDIEITSCRFNSESVEYANSVVFYYEANLIDSKNVYTALKSAFEVPGVIYPKEIDIVVDRISKEFGDIDSLIQVYYNMELNETIEFTFERETGENIGYYDIVSATSSSKNYLFSIYSNSGLDKFCIERKTLEITSNGIIIEKEYDSNIFHNELLEKDKHYILIGEIDGYEVDINILSMIYNSSTVDDASSLSVEYSNILNDINSVYKIDDGQIVFEAKIYKKKIKITPDKFIKQYGDDDKLEQTYFDDDTNLNINLTFIRNVGESVSTYDIINVIGYNSNFEFELENANEKFEIIKREISITPTGAQIAKTFDNTNVCNNEIIQKTHYLFINFIAGEEPTISFTSTFNAIDINATCVEIVDIKLTLYDDRYELITSNFDINAMITKKQVDFEPQYYSVQYLESDLIKQSYYDTELNLLINLELSRTLGDTVGLYDIVSSLSSNVNYAFNIINGIDKFEILPRILGVEIIDGISFNKVYDGTTDFDLSISQGTHYNLTNLNGGTGISLIIISKEYNSKNVDEATTIQVRYSATLEGIESGQYTTIGGTIEFDAYITPREIEVIPNKFYKDYLSSFNLVQDVIDEVSGEVVVVTFESNAGIDHTNTEAGVYDITSVNSTSLNHNFTLESALGIDKFEIVRIHLEILGNDRNTIYNNQQQGLTYYDSVPSRDLYVKYKSSSSDESFTAVAPADAGIYTARIYFDGDKNYLPNYSDKILYIDKANSIIINTTPSEYVYDGNIKPITATLNHNEMELQYSRNNHVYAGTYGLIIISVSQSKNYKAASIIVSLVIEKCEVLEKDFAFPIASDITYGQSLKYSILDNGSNLGIFSWDNPNIMPTVADTTFLVKFIPNDVINYDWSNVTMEKQIEINVNKYAVKEIIFPTATSLVYTQSLSSSSLIGTSDYGTFSWEDSSFVPSESGAFAVIFSPYDEDNYDFSQITIIQNVDIVVSYSTYFKTNGGSSIDTLIVEEITESPYTYRAGYVFDGWYTDELLTQKASFPMQITADTNLYASWHSEGLTFIKYDGYYSVKLDSLTVTSIIFIPSEYKGLPVTTIENDAFKNCTALEVIVLPSTITTIGHRAFYGCVNLAFVEICNEIENIQFGIDWVETGFTYGTDVHFGAKECPDCDGTEDFHQEECPCC